jgi:hypothetical protein
MDIPRKIEESWEMSGAGLSDITSVAYAPEGNGLSTHGLQVKKSSSIMPKVTIAALGESPQPYQLKTGQQDITTIGRGSTNELMNK